MIHGMLAAGGWQDRRGANLLDGGCPFYGTYETADGRYMAVGALEQQFYDEFVELLGIGDRAPARKDLARWGELREAVAARFRTRTRDEWTARLRGLRRLRGARCCRCARPRAHPHLAARGTFVDLGGIIQPAPAPRFSATPTAVRSGPALPGADGGRRPRLGPARGAPADAPEGGSTGAARRPPPTPSEADHDRPPPHPPPKGPP